MKIWQEKYLPIFLILLNILLTLCIFDPRLFLGGDNVTFIILARSLLDGQGYRDLSHPQAPVFIGSPPGYPVFLMLLMLLLGDLADVVLFKLASVVLSCITIYFFYLVLNFVSDNKIFIIVTSLLVVINLNILYPNHLELSDVLFNTFLFSSLYFFMSGKKQGELFGIILALLATYTRYAGIVLVFTLLAYLQLKKKYASFWRYALLSFALILPWAVFLMANGFTLTDILSGAPYAAERKLISFGQLGERWVYNFQYYFLTLFPQDVLSWLSPPVWAGILATLTILAGFYLKVKTKLSALELYSVFYAILILSWPQVWSGERYILPIIYLVVLYLAYAIFRLAKTKIFIVVLGLLILHNAYIIFKHAPSNYQRLQAFQKGKMAQYYPSEWRSFFRCCNWIRENLPAEAVIVSRKPNMLFFQTGHQGFVYPFSPDPDFVFQEISRADFILVDQFEWTNSTARHLLPALNRHREKFQILYQVPGQEFYVLRIKK